MLGYEKVCMQVEVCQGVRTRRGKMVGVQGRARSCCRSMKELVLPALMGPGPLVEFGGLVLVFTQTLKSSRVTCPPKMSLELN